MVKNPSDKRAEKTCLQLKSEMLRLLEKQPLHRITVAELCRACDVNRATFYHHFQDVFDLAEQMEDELLAQMGQVMEQLAQEQASPEEVSRRLSQFLLSQREPWALFLRCENNRRFYEKMDGMIMPYFEKRVREIYLIPEDFDPSRLQQILRFIASGYYSFFLQLLRQEEADLSAGARTAAKLSGACLDSFFQKRGE